MASKQTKPYVNLNINLPREVLERATDFRYERRIPSRTAAVIALLRAGLRAEGFPVDDEGEPVEVEEVDDAA